MTTLDVRPAEPLAIPVPELDRAVPARLQRPAAARALLVLAHGAGAGMDHPFMAAIAAGLAGQGVATLRYAFPYMAAGRRRPDPKPVLLATVGAAIATGHATLPELPLFAGGKSMGGRMTSLLLAEATAREVRGIVFLGFPLHPAGKPSSARAGHLSAVDRPMLLLQGERDRLADLALLRPVCEGLGARATLHVVPTADHGFHVLVRSGTTDTEVIGALAWTVASWIGEVGPAPAPAA